MILARRPGYQYGSGQGQVNNGTALREYYYPIDIDELQSRIGSGHLCVRLDYIRPVSLLSYTNNSAVILYKYPTDDSFVHLPIAKSLLKCWYQADVLRF